MALKHTQLQLPENAALREGRIVLLMISIFTGLSISGAVLISLLANPINFAAWTGISCCLLLASLALAGLYVELQFQKEKYQTRHEAFERMMKE